MTVAPELRRAVVEVALRQLGAETDGQCIDAIAAALAIEEGHKPDDLISIGERPFSKAYRQYRDDAEAFLASLSVDAAAKDARIAELEARVERAEAIAQAMRIEAFAAVNPANWQTGDISDAARLKHY